jgi:hypothetical protein
LKDKEKLKWDEEEKFSKLEREGSKWESSKMS